MQHSRIRPAVWLVLASWLVVAGRASAAVQVQCPGDTNGNAVEDGSEVWPVNQKCMHLTGGDGYVRMADGRALYMFGFSNVTGLPQADVLQAGILAANFPAPTITLDEGDVFYLNLSNVGMLVRPDLSDPHSVHFHGFPNASAVFDGVPESSIAINMLGTNIYYYNVAEPGTYMYHCHVEATEHMQMGMLGNLYVRPAQDGTSKIYEGETFTQFAYNDGDGSTGYDVDYAIQIGSFDATFHDSSETVQPLPFALMRDDYPMLNGRGYPDTVQAGPLGAGLEQNGGIESQPVDTLITATQGQKVLLRISNLNVTRFYTLTSPSLTMKVVGFGARLLRGPTGTDLYYDTNSVTLGGGEAVDVLIDTTGVPAGTYFLHAGELNYLANGSEEFGGMMTEIRIELP